MASQSASITSASGATSQVQCTLGTGTIAVRGDITAGKIVVAVRPPGADADYISDYIDQTAIREVADEAGTGYSYVSRFDIGPGGQIAAKADANFVGSVTVQVTSDEI